MEWLIGILLLLIGGLIGYFVAKLVNERKLLTRNDRENTQKLKDLVVQQATDHIQQSKQIVQQLSQQTEAFNQQIDNYEQLIINLNTAENGTSLNYFDEQASAYLRQNSKTPDKDKTLTDYQPLDFASQGSGLFSGSKEKKQSN
jgi:uncharacterized membrane-anchored protein YhcB (DUF1043 family)